MATVVLRTLFGLAVFAVLAAAILAKPAKRLNDFDQSFYLTIAYDLARHGVFSNGIFDAVDSTMERPPPGMFFGPLYPLVVLAAMALDPRFAAAVACAVESNHQRRDESTCEIYARPIHLMHAALLSAGVLAVALAAELLFGGALVFWLAGVLATAGLLPEADLFSFAMTESLTFALYSLAAVALVFGIRTGRAGALLAAGLLLGLLVLGRPSFQAAAPVMLAVVWLAPRIVPGGSRNAASGALAFCLGVAVVLVPWVARNQLAVGKLALTEEYGAAVVVERFAYNTMTPREFALAFAYCVPEIGPRVVQGWFGAEAMQRFDWREPAGFFATGRERRTALLARHGRLDPVVGALAAEELRTNWWRHLLVSVPLAWCGLWVGQICALVLVPLLALALVQAARERQWLFLLYAAPALAMLALHAAAANHYVRYNLILIGPAAAGGAWLLARLIAAARRRVR